MLVTRKQIRFYDPGTGSLTKILNDFLSHKAINEICSFALDDRHRKFFIGDLFGNINVCLLLSSSWDGYIRVYDEDDPEESDMLRQAKGALSTVDHQDDWFKVITVTAVDEHLGLVATGSNVGKIAVWDLESFKVEAFLQGNSKEITGIAFVTPYPVMVSSCSEGIICIFGVRGVSPDHITDRYSCLMRIVNTDQNVLITQPDHNQVHVGVNAIFIRKSGPLLETDTVSKDI